MRTSDSTTALVAALVKARADFPAIPKDAVARVGKDGAREYHYADLSAILDAIGPVLAVRELAILQSVDAESSSLITRLAHTSGEWVECTYPLQMEQAPQALGSALTYARRYSIQALLCLAAADDDGAQAKPAKPAKAKAAPAPESAPELKRAPLITQPQRKRMFAIATKAGWTTDQVKAHLLRRFGLESTGDIRGDQYDALCDTFAVPFEPEGEHA